MKQKLGLIFQLVWMSLLLGVLFAYAMFEGGFTSWFLFDSFVPIFIYLLCLQFYPLRGWQVKRKLSRRYMRAGDQLRVEITLKRKFPFPLYYCVIEEMMPESLHRLDIRKKKFDFMDAPERLSTKREMKRLIFPWFKKEMIVSYDLVQLPRGHHAFTAIRVRTGDVFGLMKKQHIFQEMDEWIVYPAQPDIKLKELMKNQKQGSLASSAMHPQSGNIATSIREYVPGDKFSWIDWKQTAKKNDVMTKEFEKDKSSDVLIILDACRHDYQNWIHFDALVELSASLLTFFQKKSSKTTLLTVGDKATHFPVTNNKVNMDRIYHYLASAEPIEASFPALLLQEMHQIPSRAMAYVLTTRMDKTLFEVLRKMNMHHNGIHLLYITSETDVDQLLIRHMIKQGIAVTILTKKQLMAEPIEVNAF